jgi:hypothetical protein
MITNMRKLPLILALTLTSVTLGSPCIACHVFTQEQRKVVVPSTALPVPASEELAAYSAVIEQAYPESRGKLVVIADRTNDCPPYEKEPNWEQNTLNRMPEVSVATFGDYLVKNRQCSSLLEGTELKSRYTVIPDEEVMAVIRSEEAGGWDAFYRKYPNSIGFLTFSRIGFNPELNQALVYTGRYHGVRRGSGMDVLLSKKTGSWVVVKRYKSWSS